MGAFTIDTPKLLWLCAIILVTGLVTTYQVSAESAKEDSDLVFDNLDQTNVRNHENHHRISRDAISDEIPLDSSPSVEEHWLSTTVNRLKRSINSFLNNKNEDSHSRTKRKLGRVPRQDPAGQQEAGDYDEDDEYDEVPPNGDDEDDNGEADDYDDGLNTTGGGDEDEDEDEEEVDLEQQQVEEEEEEEQLAQTVVYDVAATAPTPNPETGEDRTEAYLTNGNTSKLAHRHNESVNSDDEDFGGVSGSGEVESEPPLVSPDYPVYFRMSLTVSEPFVEEFEDRNSFKYRDFTEDLVDGIEDLFREVPGTQSATVIKIQKREADTFTSLATVDLGSVGFSDHQVIRDTIQNQIEDHHRIGSVTVLPDDFQFRAFEVPPKRCEGTDLPCQSGECVPATARCNGHNDCNDGSDELGCQPLPPVTTPIDQDLGSGDGETRLESSKCRADDIVTCSDGSRTICSDHVCDGVRHCDDGGDEENCPTDCAEGEFICDISRCIHINKRCDGVKDCTDGTDERECVQCQSNEINCDNKCVPLSKRCDGVPDCTSGVDEINCQSK